MKTIITFVLYLSIIIGNENLDIGFRYGFLSKPTYDSHINTNLSDSSIIHSGNYLRINIGYLTESNIQIIYKSAVGEYLLLDFKEASSNNPKITQQDTTYYTALNWTDIEPPSGTETFYFINSFEPLTKLTELFKKYDRAPAKGQKKLAKRIQDEINFYDSDIQADLSSLSSQLEKPVTGGVAFRGENDGINDLSVTHECKGKDGIAFKKIILIHK